MNRFFALVAEHGVDVPFIIRMTSTLAQFGKLLIVPESELPTLPKRTAMVVIDASDVQDAPALVQEMRAARPNLPIIVFMLEHDWNAARKVYKAGATDCLVKGLDEDVFVARLKNEYLKPVRQYQEGLW